MSTLNDIDENTLAQLTPEERAAIEDTDSYTEEELAALQAVADGAADTDLDDDDNNDPDAAKPDAATAKPDDVPNKLKAHDTDPAKEPVVEPAVDKSTETPEPTKADPKQEGKAKDFTPRYESKLPDDYEAQATSLKEQEAALKAEFKAGDIEFEAYEERRDALQQQREDLMVARVKSEVSQDFNTQTAAQQWQANVDSFLTRTAKEEGGIDYRADQDKAADLDQFVKVLASRADNSDKPMEWFLVEADRRVKALHGMTAPTKEVTPEPTSETRKPDISQAPKTLAQVPGSVGASDIEGEFANIDNLEGEELEAAIAKMTPAQRKRFEKA